MPVAHSLWRDMLAFIPAYAVTLFAGTCVFAALLARRVLHVDADWRVFAVAAALAGGAAIADYVEDFIHLRYLRVFPRAPGGGLVATAFAASLIKIALCIAALAATLAAVIWLTVLEAPRLMRRESGALRAVFVLVPLLLVVLAAAARIRANRRAAHAG